MFKQRLRGAAFSASFKYNTQKIFSAVDSLNIPHSRNAEYVNRQSVKLAAVRLDLRRYNKLSEFVAHMSAFVEKAAAQGAQFVAFPELTGMTAASLLPKFDRLLKDSMNLERTDENLREAFRLGVEVFSGFFEEIFSGSFSALAGDWRIPIAAGSYYTVDDDDRIVNRQLLFDEKGRLAGLQDKLFPSAFEHRLGVSPGERLGVFDTAVGRVALLTASDAMNFEPFWIAKTMGAEIAVAGADPLGLTPDAAVYRANESRICIVSPGVVVETPLLRHSAHAAVRAPLSATKNQDGLITEGGEAAVGRVDLERIALDFDVYSADENPDFIRRFCSASPRDTT